MIKLHISIGSSLMNLLASYQYTFSGEMVGVAYDDQDSGMIARQNFHSWVHSEKEEDESAVNFASMSSGLPAFERRTSLQSSGEGGLQTWESPSKNVVISYFEVIDNLRKASRPASELRVHSAHNCHGSPHSAHSDLAVHSSR